MGPVVLEEVIPSLTSVPTCYHDLKEVFSKPKATSLPPHHPYNCGIDLFPGIMAPKGRLYFLSGPETQAMKEYVQCSLQAGKIQPSSSLGWSWVFLHWEGGRATSTMH